jgi:hypothetical protein
VSDVTLTSSAFADGQPIRRLATPALGVDDLVETRSRLQEQGIEPERSRTAYAKVAQDR